MTDDPYRVLGVAPDASRVQLVSARRQLAQRLHPDRGGDAAAMQAVNAAYDEALRRLAAAPTTRTVDPPPPTPQAAAPTGRRLRGLQHDSPSFTIDVLPVDAFEALLVVTSWMGEVLVDDPPYVLETFLHDPALCWCRLDLVPDAGATTVSLTVAAIEGESAPDIDDVRDEWIANLNRISAPPS